ncbi:NAD(P)H-binding protein [Paenibacillus rhizovicinus]|uniref:NAD(P)H-binding protein n=1 Tax=Paenibacillus rhizovicinus TaxID=2704463 RepID=A0A6C0P1J4_9BACL|nr:NAD(P)H-binding protein [Paenibacillus rhizovicinus]QHW32106.1 NAD(P)H-binding protein [Paenibacillus rhizovicinus]
MPRTEGYSALLAGATGLVGFQLLRQLLKDDHCRSLTVLARRPLPHLPELAAFRDKLHVITADFDRMGEALADVQADVVFCALGTTIKKAKSQDAFRQVDLGYPVALGEWAKANEAKKLIIVSAMGANEKSVVFYNRVKGEAEALLSAIGVPELHIVRPSLLLGKREEFRPGERVAVLLSPALKLLMRGPLLSYRPVHAEDVAAFMRSLASAPAEQLAPIVNVYENHAITANQPKV